MTHLDIVLTDDTSCGGQAKGPRAAPLRALKIATETTVRRTTVRHKVGESGIGMYLHSEPPKRAPYPRIRLQMSRPVNGSR